MPPLPDRNNSISPPHDRPPRATMPSSSSTHGLIVARDIALSRKLQAMLLETAKQQVHVNTTALDRIHRFEEPTDFYSLVTLPMRLENALEVNFGVLSLRHGSPSS